MREELPTWPWVELLAVCAAWVGAGPDSGHGRALTETPLALILVFALAAALSVSHL